MVEKRNMQKLCNLPSGDRYSIQRTNFCETNKFQKDFFH